MMLLVLWSFVKFSVLLTLVSEDLVTVYGVKIQ